MVTRVALALMEPTAGSGESPERVFRSQVVCCSGRALPSNPGPPTTSGFTAGRGPSGYGRRHQELGRAVRTTREQHWIPEQRAARSRAWAPTAWSTAPAKAGPWCALELGSCLIQPGSCGMHWHAHTTELRCLMMSFRLNVPGRRSQGITQPQGPLHADVACPEVVYQD